MELITHLNPCFRTVFPDHDVFPFHDTVKVEKDTWSGKNEALTAAGGKVKRDVTAERRLMELEAKKREDRARELSKVYDIAKEHERRVVARKAREMETAREKLRAEARKRSSEKMAVCLIQRVYRGHLGRLVAKKWAAQMAEFEALRVLKVAAAVAIQRVWRGYLGREEAEDHRLELADFVMKLREEEAEEEEEEYWKTHALARWKRDLSRLWNWRRTQKLEKVPLPDWYRDGAVDNDDDNDGYDDEAGIFGVGRVIVARIWN